MLKKFFITFLLSFISYTSIQIFPATVFGAKLPPKEMFLGGISLDQDGVTVEKIYGIPDEKFFWRYDDEGNYPKKIQTKDELKAELEKDGYSYYWGAQFSYGDSVFIQTHEMSVTNIICVTANNGWKTPKGIGVGSSMNEVEKAYGKPFKTKKKGNYILYIYEGNTIYNHYNNSTGKYEEIISDGHLMMTFDKKTKTIKKIALSTEYAYESMLDFMLYKTNWYDLTKNTTWHL